jgi:hypothetical protein
MIQIIGKLDKGKCAKGESALQSSSPREAILEYLYSRLVASHTLAARVINTWEVLKD